MKNAVGKKCATALMTGLLLSGSLSPAVSGIAFNFDGVKANVMADEPSENVDLNLTAEIYNEGDGKGIQTEVDSEGHLKMTGDFRFKQDGTPNYITPPSESVINKKDLADAIKITIGDNEPFSPSEGELNYVYHGGNGPNHSDLDYVTIEFVQSGTLASLKTTGTQKVTISGINDFMVKTPYLGGNLNSKVDLSQVKEEFYVNYSPVKASLENTTFKLDENGYPVIESDVSFTDGNGTSLNSSYAPESVDMEKFASQLTYEVKGEGENPLFFSGSPKASELDYVKDADGVHLTFTGGKLTDALFSGDYTVSIKGKDGKVSGSHQFDIPGDQTVYSYYELDMSGINFLGKLSYNYDDKKWGTGTILQQDLEIERDGEITTTVDAQGHLEMTGNFKFKTKNGNYISPPNKIVYDDLAKAIDIKIGDKPTFHPSPGELTYDCTLANVPNQSDKDFVTITFKQSGSLANLDPGETQKVTITGSKDFQVKSNYQGKDLISHVDLSTIKEEFLVNHSEVDASLGETTFKLSEEGYPVIDAVVNFTDTEGNSLDSSFAPENVDPEEFASHLRYVLKGEDGNEYGNTSPKASELSYDKQADGIHLIFKGGKITDDLPKQNYTVSITADGKLIGSHQFDIDGTQTVYSYYELNMDGIKFNEGLYYNSVSEKWQTKPVHNLELTAEVYEAPTFNVDSEGHVEMLGKYKFKDSSTGHYVAAPNTIDKELLSKAINVTITDLNNNEIKSFNPAPSELEYTFKSGNPESHVEISFKQKGGSMTDFIPGHQYKVEFTGTDEMKVETDLQDATVISTVNLNDLSQTYYAMYSPVKVSNDEPSFNIVDGNRIIVANLTFNENFGSKNSLNAAFANLDTLEAQKAALAQHLTYYIQKEGSEDVISGNPLPEELSYEVNGSNIQLTFNGGPIKGLEHGHYKVSVVGDGDLSGLNKFPNDDKEWNAFYTLDLKDIEFNGDLYWDETNKQWTTKEPVVVTPPGNGGEEQGGPGETGEPGENGGTGETEQPGGPTNPTNPGKPDTPKPNPEPEKPVTPNPKPTTPAPKPTVVNPTSVKITGPSDRLAKGKTMQLTAKVNPTNATNKNVTWSSSNTKVATVDSKGKVKAKAAGSVTITAKTANNKKATYKITVTNSLASTGIEKVAVKSLAISGKKTVSVTQKVKLSAKIKPTNATEKTVKWTTSNKKIAKVDSKGNVTGVKSGKVTITAKSKNGKKATYKMTVKAFKKVYRASKGDNLSRIAKKFGIKHWRNVWNWNKNIKNPHFIKIAQKIILWFK